MDRQGGGQGRATGRIMAALAVVLAGGLAGCVSLPVSTPGQREASARAVIENWSTDSRLLAAKFLEQYGSPDRVASDRLTWEDKGPWQATTVYDRVPFYTADDGPDDLRQSVARSVPPDKIFALRQFSGKLQVSRDGSLLSANSTSEAVSFLLVNLADDVIAGRASPQAAAAAYERAIQLYQAGKTPPAMQGLLWTGKPAAGIGP